ncbi:sugar kinase [Avibacterium paragallinarum]|uniref:2-dehydro-3-deoxygluconokinase n=1 Tax=Avibacterium paragallinarum TaxID=728 RepID=A0A377IA95_AVIPA|nr:sugar kinase [Avibacterium paragallinarum]POY47318.1 sugar kinase [Avibacterium paragallinarum]RZN77022.1 sugar kinase [Avibacterium paragallinarum]CDF98996.1 Putative Carbohydrate kinase, PfkB family [Avibacterium paragallinarum JF4211]STO71682.1 2-dehydro-3-deoxygluconokinase [Avibacterium paragallinarum]
MKKIAIIGECMIELNGEPFGNMWQTYGGDTLNTATYLARVSNPQDIDVHYITAMGADKLSQQMIQHWQQDHINTGNVLIDPHRQAGLYLIQLDKFGERTFLYWRSESAARYLLQHPDYSQVQQQLSEMDMIYLSGISLAILPDADRYALIAQLKQLASQGVKIAFDSNYRPKLWESVEKTQEIYTALLPFIDLALVTFDDEQALWGDSETAQSVQRLKDFGVKNIVLKQGKDGALFCDAQGNEQHIATTPVANVVDTTSAGDAFNAGFLNGYLRDKLPQQCCQQGNQVAGIVIQHKGAIIDKNATAHLIHQFN